MEKNEAADKKLVSVDKKIVPMNKKVIPKVKKIEQIDKKIVPADKKIVQMDKKKVLADKKIVQMDKKIIPTDKKIVQMNKQLPTNNKILQKDNRITLIDKKLIPLNKKIISADNFQLKIFQEINKSNIGKNIMVSPLSIYHILSLTANGAANKTLVEMLQALSEKNLIELNKNNKIISSSITNLKSIELANAVFTRFKPLENFLKIIREYKAKLDELKDAAQINKWCSDATHKKIPKIIDNISGGDKMVLINAIYFKGIWQQPFDKNDTRLDTFLNFNKQPKKVDYMNSAKKFDYFEDVNIQAISLNYNKDNLKALIILPKKETDINNYINNFTSEQYHIIKSKLINKKVILSLPKFEINFNTELSANFQSLGMKEAFTNNADFSSMKKEKDIKISRIIHKTFIKVDEKGTEAAAVTAVVMRMMCAFPQEPDPIMKVDHPFLFIISNNDLPHRNDIIFISKVESL